MTASTDLEFLLLNTIERPVINALRKEGLGWRKVELSGNHLLVTLRNGKQVKVTVEEVSE